MPQVNPELHAGDPCPLCHAPLVLRQSERGEFLGCSAYPVCNFMLRLPKQDSVIALITLDALCPRCGHVLQVKKGRFGMFIGCSDYPQCDYTAPRGEAEEQISCPICRKGRLGRHMTRTGRTFYACSAYPECNYTLPGKPVAKTCEICAFPVCYEKKTKQRVKLVCGNSLCASRRRRRSKV